MTPTHSSSATGMLTNATNRLNRIKSSTK